MAHYIETLKDLKAEIKKCPEIYIAPRFGLSEQWLRITKKEALYLISHYPDNATSKSLEMDKLGEIINQSNGRTKYIRALYMG